MKLSTKFVCFPALIAFWLCFAVTASSDHTPPNESLEQAELTAKNTAKQWDAASARRALELYLNLANQWKELHRFDRQAEALREAAKLQLMLGNAKDAVDALETALNVENNNPAGKAETRAQLSLVALESGDNRKSKDYYLEAIALAESSNNIKAQARAYFSASEFLYLQRSVHESNEYARRSLELFKRAGDLAGQAQTLVSLAYLEMAHSKPTEGLVYAQEALSIYQNLQDKRGQAFALIAIGHLQTTRDESQSALNSYLAAEKLFPGDVNLTEKAMLLNGIGAVFEDYGEWRRSLHYRQKAFALYDKIRHEPGKMATIPSLAKLSRLTGDLTAAVEYLKQGEVLANKLNDDTHRGYIWKEFGNIYCANNSYEEAAEYYQRALKVSEKVNFKKNVALLLNHLGTVYERQGKTELARRNYLTALEHNRNTNSKFPEAETLFHLAQLDASQDRLDSALTQIEDSLKITESLRGDVANQRLRRTYLSQVFERYEFYIALLMQMHGRFPQEGYDVRALQASERTRARTLIEFLRASGIDLTQGVEPQLRQREKEARSRLNLKADSLTNLLSIGSHEGQIEKVNREIEELTAEYEEIRAEIKVKASPQSLLNHPAEFDVRKFQSEILDDQTVLLEFSLGREKSFLWLVSRSGVQTIVLPPQAEIDERVRRLLGLLNERELKAGEELEAHQQRLMKAEADYGREAQELSYILLKPVAGELKGKRLLVVADGSLHYLPLAALPSPSSETNTPLVVEHEIVYQPSASTLLLINNTAAPAIENPKSILAFADPIFSPHDERLNGQKAGNKDESLLSQFTALFRSDGDLNDTDAPDKSLARLRASQREADSIAKIAGAENAKIISGEAASRESVFAAEIADYRIIHFATHSLMNEEHPEMTGIAMSRYDKNGQQREGFVRLNDIYDLKLSADLVVLSSCNSGIGKEIRGEGIIGLTRGFLQAGSKSVLASAWKVEDNATAELMEKFYAALLTEKLTPPQALRKAQIQMRQHPRWQSPFFWAAFTVQGEYRRPITPVAAPAVFNATLYSFSLPGGAIILASLGLFFFFRRRKNKR